MSRFEPSLKIPLIAALAVIVGQMMPPSSALAGVKPGDFITWKNAESKGVKHLVPPGVWPRIMWGMTIKVVPTEVIAWPPPYKDATEKYSQQVRLTPDHRSLRGYVAGQPFPLIDPNDPDAGTKISWNVAFRPISTDDYDLRWFNCESVYAGRNKAYFVIDDIEIGHYAGYNLVGRTEIDPLPIDPNFKLTNRYYLALLYPVLAPASARGSGIVKFRYADGNRQDDIWSYQVGSRRVRRVSYSIGDTSTGIGGYHFNNWEAFSAKRENYDFHYLGEKTMLSAIDVSKVPDRVCPTDGGASHCPDEWQLRHTYIIEAVPRKEKYEPLYAKLVLYVDQEADFPMFVDEYDLSGKLFKNYTSWMAYSAKATPYARVAVYPFKRLFQVGSSAIDLQGGDSAVCYHPSRRAPSPEAWFINMGAVDKDWFTANAMQRAAKGGHAMTGD